MQNNKTIFTANSLSDVLYHIKNVTGIEIVAGCTQLKTMPEKSIPLRLIPEMLTIERHELYIDIGGSVTLSDILLKEGGNLPEILREALQTIGTERIRALATIGGNIAAKDTHHTLYSPLLALNARLELRTPADTALVPLAKFDGIRDGQILTKVRIPLDDWEVEIFRRIGPPNRIGPLSASFSFLASTQRNVVSNLKIVFAGDPLFYSNEFENRIIGTRLPLTGKLIDESIEEAEKIYEEENPSSNFFLKVEFLNLLRYSLEQLS